MTNSSKLVLYLDGGGGGGGGGVKRGKEWVSMGVPHPIPAPIHANSYVVRRILLCKFLLLSTAVRDFFIENWSRRGGITYGREGEREGERKVRREHGSLFSAGFSHSCTNFC